MLVSLTGSLVACLPTSYRFELETAETVNEFLAVNNLKYLPVGSYMLCKPKPKHTNIQARINTPSPPYPKMDPEEKKELLPYLVASGFKLNQDDVMRSDYFRIAFEEALELVRSRKVYVHRGDAFIPRRDMMSIIAGLFRARLSAALTATSKALPNLEEDNRLLPMLNNLSKQYLGQEYGDKKSSDTKVTPADIPKVRFGVQCPLGRIDSTL